MSRIGGLLRRLAGRPPETICPLPWVNLSLDVDGSSRPCCKFAHQQADSRYQLANLRDSSLEDTWNSRALQRLRKDFRRGRKPVECSACWDEERAGIASFRQTYLRDRNISPDIDFDDLTPDAPRALDLKLSNSCNLKCRICGPVASSLWLSEELRVADTSDGHRQFLADNQVYFRSNKITDRADQLATFRSWLPRLEHLELTGGEPMLSPENRQVIELVVTEGRPEQVDLLLTTNAMVVDARIVDHVPRFKSATLTASIDDIGPRLEYERAPAKWETVQANLDRYVGMASDRVQVYVNCSVSIFNVWYLPEMLAWVKERYPGGEVQVGLNLVHGPRYYCVQVLPPAVKERVEERLRSITNDCSYPETMRREVGELIEFLGYTAGDDARDWTEAVATIRQRDTVRSERFDEVFAEFHRVLVDAGAWPEDTERAVGLRRTGTAP